MRAPFLDALRGIAVVWMIIFHFAYDLRMFHYVDWDFGSGFWWCFPRVIAFTFLFCVGVSLNFVHQNGVNWKALQNRSVKLGLAALAVSLGTYFTFHQGWIFFGTLHCIFVGSLLGAFFVKHRPWAWAVMLLILVLQYGLGYDIKWVSSIVQKPSMDFIPIYPWFWGILLGLLTGPYLSKSRQLNNFTVPAPLKFLGQNSLVIYLVHQPLFYGLLWLTSAFI